MANDPQAPQQTTGTPDVQSVLSDPDFHALPMGEKHKVLTQVDPDYAGLPPKEQVKALTSIHYGTTTEPESPEGFLGAAWNDIKSIPGSVAKMITQPPELTAAQMVSSGTQQWQKEKELEKQYPHAGYGTPYRIGAAIASAAGTNVRGMEEATTPGGVLGHAAVGAVQAATPLLAEIPSKIHDAMEPGRVAEGQTRLKGALQTPVGPKGTRASKMASDIESAKGDLADIFRDNNVKLKGTDAEKFNTAADAIKDWKDNLWDTTHTPMVQNHGHLLFDNQAVLGKALSAIDPLDDSVQAAGARDWANREIPKMQTLADADKKIHLLNNDPALKTSIPGAYDAVGKKVRFAALDATRQQLDTHLINDAGEMGLQDQPDTNGKMVPGVNKRYGALNNIEGQLRSRAEQLEKGNAGKQTLLPQALHSYIFAHGMSPTVGIAANLQKLMNKTPGDLLTSGVKKIADSHLKSPEVTLGQPTPPGQYPGGVAPTGPQFPQTPGGAAPMQPGPFRGLLPGAGGTSGPRTSAGPSMFPLPMGETTPQAIMDATRQLPEKAGVGKVYPPAPNLIRSNRFETDRLDRMRFGSVSNRGEQPVEFGSNMMPASTVVPPSGARAGQFEAPSNRMGGIPSTIRDAAMAKNASGESNASLEAIHRQVYEKAQGVRRFRIDTRSGQRTPLTGVDAVDAKAGKFDVLIQEGPKGSFVLDKGANAQWPLPGGTK